jgi:hypothetical protein
MPKKKFKTNDQLISGLSYEGNAFPSVEKIHGCIIGVVQTLGFNPSFEEVEEAVLSQYTIRRDILNLFFRNCTEFVPLNQRTPLVQPAPVAALPGKSLTSTAHRDDDEAEKDASHVTALQNVNDDLDSNNSNHTTCCTAEPYHTTPTSRMDSVRAEGGAVPKSPDRVPPDYSRHQQYMHALRTLMNA